MRVMIFGAGFSGKAAGALLASAGHTVFGTTRSAEKAHMLGDSGIQPLIFDGQTVSPEVESELSTVTHLVQSIAPGQEGDPLIRLFGKQGLRSAMPALQWVCYYSTVGVYGDHDGAWVNEESPLSPVSQRSLERVEAENGWLELGSRDDLPVAILRLSGIYGPGRNTFHNIAKGTARRLVKKDQVFNRIRVEDIARATAFLAERNTGGIFNITDDEPCPPQDVVTEACRLAGIEPPPEQPFETADLTPMARSFYGENKRVSNGKIKALGFSFLHGNYKQSLEELYHLEGWNKFAF
ncbi:SDR family oxidoreductase [Peteryoungia desertarenae]|uniref:SDR family oxidoreductase n=1 Tax=Peteryoungia desertarenae TaxID=1813451 RepID=A0ABX6QM35_9HYPH|nr:SDR family oxidoreductase [Peteryoungia desertarenae]QLF69145.1 SDR family oxidoreductase [Peteryoungia desertarenae]